MPITRLLTDSKFTPEQRQVLEEAFHATLHKLSLVESAPTPQRTFSTVSALTSRQV